MATSSTFYLNAPSLGSATAAFLDSNLTVCAPDGFYSDGVIVREQISCVLLPQQTCPACAVPCGSPINGTGGQGIYIVNLDAGNSIGAIIVRFNPYSIPDGIKATFNGIVYNKLTSPIDGIHQSINAGHYTFVGNTIEDCGISGTTYPALQEFLYNGTAFTPTGLTQSVTVAPGDVSLGATPGNCMMVIPKSSASPSIINFEMVGPCIDTGWLLNIACPVLLTGFSSSSVFASSTLACDAGKIQTYYNASLDNTPGIIDVFDFVYSDNLGAVPLANGFYNATGSISGGANWFQVSNGVVIAVGNCDTPPDAIPLEWSFVQISAMGQMDLYVNSVIVETRTIADTGVYYVYAGDTISVSVSTSGCVLPGIKANAYSQILIEDGSCADYNTSFSSADYVVTSGDIGTTLVLNTFARCASACI